jgi:hypothetical protein
MRTCYPVDIALLYKEATRMKQYATEAVHKKHPTWNTNKDSGSYTPWKSSKYTDKDGVYTLSPHNTPSEIFDYLHTMIHELNLDKCERVSPRYYYLPGGQYLPNHSDDDTTCAVNFILSKDYVGVSIGGDMGAPIIEGAQYGEQYHYSQGVLDTTQIHGIDNRECSEERVLLKISIFGTTYQQVCNLIPKEYII